MENQMDNTSEDELETCRAEVRRLSEILAGKEKEEAENALFVKYFPEVDQTEIPDSVKQDAADMGIPYAYTYALYHRECQLQRGAESHHRENLKGRSSGKLFGDFSGEEDYSLEEIRTMSRSQVRKNYRAIMRSLNKKR